MSVISYKYDDFIPFLFSLWACSNDKTSDSEQTDLVDTSTIEIGTNPRIHRLTHHQWTNSIHSLLNIDASEMASNFQQATLSEGFSNNGEVLAIDPILFQDYQRAAEALARQVVSDLNLYEYAVPEDPRDGGSTIAFSQRIEAESEDAVATTGGISGNDRYNLWSNGTLSVEFTLPNSGLYTIRTWVSGTT